MVSRQLAAAALLILLLAEEEESEEDEEPRKRRLWSQEWLLERDAAPQDSTLREMGISSTRDFRSCLRMPEDAFRHLLSLVTPYIQKRDTCMRRAITVEQRLVATLRYLATGQALQDLKFTTRISPQALGIIIPETCAAIIDCLREEYMKFPITAADWMAVAQDFEDSLDFPNCGGAIGGRHIRIATASDSQNYKGFSSIALMAIVNAQKEFLMVDIGKKGCMSDGEMIEQVMFYQKLVKKELALPATYQTKLRMNFVFVADEAFALSEHILKPYPQESADFPRKIFNCRLSHARSVFNDAFELLANRFRVLQTSIKLRVDKVDQVVLACCMLHNYLRRRYGDVEEFAAAPGGVRAQPGTQTSLQACVPQNETWSAINNRDQYQEYFNEAGAVDWQYNMDL
ncbi:putative nuclease HARBI1 [Hyperolius riggenbachi]|uniref:putative nuclease HARBI1 n=1 Tax=Hyperolius riggenbachi TaxID=752182 RepID=UPI0035A3C1B5